MPGDLRTEIWSRWEHSSAGEDLRVTTARWLFNHDVGFNSLPITASDWLIHETYAKAILCCANGDGELSLPEREWVLGYFAGLGAPESVIELLRDYPATEDVIQLVTQLLENAPPGLEDKTDPGTVARPMLFDAIRAASADGEFQPGERATIERLAISLGLTTNDVQDLEAAYKEEQHAVEKRLQLMFPDGRPF